MMTENHRGFRGMNERWRVGILLALALLVYGNTLWNSFVFDDNVYVLKNPAVTTPSLRALFAPTKHNNVFRPATFASFAVDWKLGGGRPLAYHLVNLLLHAAVTVLFYLVLRKLLEGVAKAETIAFAAALLFAVHPIHSEAVAWVSARSELLATAFVLGTWLLHLEDRPIPALICFAVALLSKESAMAFLPLALISDYVCGKLKPARTYAWLAVTAASYVALLWKVQGGRFGEKSVSFADNPLVVLPALWRILNALRIAWKYVGLQVYPATLSCDYSYNAILLYMNWQRVVPAGIAAVLVLAVWIWAVWKRKSEWALAGAIYFAGFAVTANLLVATGTIMGERLAYFPSAGFCLLVAAIWSRLEMHRRELAWSLLVILVATFAGRTLVRNRDWRNNLTLFTAAVRAVPQSTKAHGNLGVTYVYVGQSEGARRELETALRIYPNVAEYVGFHGIVESRLGKDDDALSQMEKAVATSSPENINYDFLAVNLAAQLTKMCKDDEALKLLNQIVRESPAESRAWSNRAVIWYRRGELGSARSDAEEALKLEPNNTQAQDLLKTLNGTASATAQ